MRNHIIYSKGEQIHCLLSSYNFPNILIPVKAIIQDAKWDDVNPQYLVKVTKFYDSYSFLKKYIFEMNFSNKIGVKSRRFPLHNKGFKKIADIENAMNQSDSDKYFIVVDSIMATKTKADMQKLFEKVQYFLISRNLKEVKEMTTRVFYKGILRIDTGLEFNKRLGKFISDKFDRKGEDFERYVSSL